MDVKSNFLHGYLQEKKITSNNLLPCEHFHCFHMEYYKPYPYYFQYGLNIISTCTTPELDATFYHNLFGIYFYLTNTHPNISFVVDFIS
jgi:hypothetical protein